MGYNTKFSGEFELDRPLSPDHAAILVEISQEEHIPGENGKPLREASSGRPCVYCQWIPTDDLAGLEWDDGEKFYGWLEWLEYLIERHLKPWGYVVNG